MAMLTSHMETHYLFLVVAELFSVRRLFLGTSELFLCMSELSSRHWYHVYVCGDHLLEFFIGAILGGQPGMAMRLSCRALA